MDFKKITLFLLASFITSLSLAQVEGPQSGGGGGTVYMNNQPVVIDFYNFTNPEKLQYLISQKFPGMGIGRNEDSAVALSVQAQAILERWSILDIKADYNNQNMRTWQDIQYKFTNEVENSLQTFRPLALGQQLKIISTAYYYYGGLVQISSSVWQSMNRANRLALVLHERLRHLQITMGYYFDDEFLQKATVVLLVCKPDSQFVQGILYSKQYSSHQSELMQNLNNYANSCLGSGSQVVKLFKLP